MSETRPATWPLFLILMALAFAVYGSGIGIPRLGDDYDIVFEQPGSKIFYYFTHENPFSLFYRPIEAAYSAFMQSSFGERTWPIQLTQIILHALLAGGAATVIVALGFSRLHAALGGAFMTLSQANVFAVMSNDTLSQIGATGCGFLALWQLVRAYETGATAAAGQSRVCRKRFSVALGAVVLTLLFKESGLSVVPMWIVLLVALNLRDPARRRRIVANTCLHTLPVVAIAAVYLVIRFSIVHAELAQGDQPMAIRLGPNIIKNLAMLAFAITMPTATDVTYVLMQARSWPLVGAIAAGAAAFSLLVLVGLYKARDRAGAIGVVGLLALLSFFPHALLNKVGELYAYNAAPYIAILVGIGLGQLLSAASRNRAAHTALVLLILSFFVANVVATRNKTHRLYSNGVRAVALLEQLKQFAGEVPENGQILIRNPPPAELNYSIFRMPGLYCLPGKWDQIAIVVGRRDLEIRPIPAESFPTSPQSPGTLLLSVDGDRLVRWPVR